MKIFTAEQIQKIDEETVIRKGISSFELMEYAATAFYQWFIGRYPSKDTSVAVIAGVGNNGGDALAVARLLREDGYAVRVYVVEYSKSYSTDCIQNINLVKQNNIPCDTINVDDGMPSFDVFDIIVDGIFGTGLNRVVSGIARKVIELINNSGKVIVSIDVPSGLFMDMFSPFAVQASYTVTFQIPKLALYLPDNRHFTGDVCIVDIGLDEDAISEVKTDMFFILNDDIKALLKPLKRFTHKGVLGHAMIVGGSKGMIGSVCLASKAALKTGCGLVTAYLPGCGVPIIQGYFPEAMAIGDTNNNHISSISHSLKIDAVGIGVGMGQHEDTCNALREFLKINNTPLVIDADALNILAKNIEWLSLLRRHTILTPHPKELSRLIGDWDNDFEKIEKTRAFCKKYDVIVVVKGAYSMVVESESIYINSNGTPALATAGSGDVLTGMITSLLSQGYTPLNATKMGVYLHGITANLSIGSIHERSFTASNIIEFIGNAYSFIES